MLRTCVQPGGEFKVGVHKPCYQVRNLRKKDHVLTLGHTDKKKSHDNRKNFPQNDVAEENGRIIYEIANAFSFRGATFIDSGWAAARARDPLSICISRPPECSLRDALHGVVDSATVQKIINNLPKPLLYDLAANSTDPDELILLARSCSTIEEDEYGNPTGLAYTDKNGTLRADIDDFELFETIANNPFLPDTYKEVMVLRPGVQGGSEIVGDWQEGETHVFEYLRRNSYIPWGHFAANMAHDAVRYATSDLTRKDMQGLRYLYYQRMVVTLAGQFGIDCPVQRHRLTSDELENLRLQVLDAIQGSDEHPATLWGWNFGYDFSGSGYRLHASHQMIHQQFAMVPDSVEMLDGSRVMGYSCGDQVAEVVELYSQEHNSDFFTDFIQCIRTNSRSDQCSGNSSLIIWEDENVMLFAPKAQVSQWELQLMVLANDNAGAVGNILEADTAVRNSLDTGILLAQRIYAGLGAKMVSSIEYSKRLGINNRQRLVYAFLPKLPWSMGAFSEAQQRYISGHFAEDFAYACRKQLPNYL